MGSLVILFFALFRIGISAFLLEWSWSRLRKEKITFRGFITFFIFCLGIGILLWSKCECK
ncbi:MAG: hypothetical protein C5B45_00815 [Chlamydiae bacterium]|nr:MAG: hypothetical protein C5B45_00815 [Chlamydiota bacterium]